MTARAHQEVLHEVKKSLDLLDALLKNSLHPSEGIVIVNMSTVATSEQNWGAVQL
jgi:hypothetical protein